MQTSVVVFFFCRIPKPVNEHDRSKKKKELNHKITQEKKLLKTNKNTKHVKREKEIERKQKQKKKRKYVNWKLKDNWKIEFDGCIVVPDFYPPTFICFSSSLV